MMLAEYAFLGMFLLLGKSERLSAISALSESALSLFIYYSCMCFIFTDNNPYIRSLPVLSFMAITFCVLPVYLPPPPISPGFPGKAFIKASLMAAYNLHTLLIETWEIVWRLLMDIYIYIYILDVYGACP